jgi:hypothetical protein
VKRRLAGSVLDRITRLRITSRHACSTQSISASLLELHLHFPRRGRRHQMRLRGAWRPQGPDCGDLSQPRGGEAAWPQGHTYRWIGRACASSPPGHQRRSAVPLATRRAERREPRPASRTAIPSRDASHAQLKHPERGDRVTVSSTQVDHRSPATALHPRPSRPGR